MDVGAAALAGDLYGSGAAGEEEETLLFDAGVAVQMLLQLVAVADSLPDILVLDLGGGVAQPDRLLCRRHHCAPCLFESIVTHGVALTAR